MKIEVGMYVRTERGKIWLVTSTKAIDGHKRRIVKASYNIVDLIQIGDYVNGCLVVNKYEACDYAEQCIKLKGNANYFYDIHIKSIVTKEQFEQMEYKVGE